MSKTTTITITIILFISIYTSIIITLLYTKLIKKENYKLLEITPSKKCVLGPYTWGKEDSDLYKFCNNPINFDAINKQRCKPGFHGFPVNWEYTPESDEKWKNNRCSKQLDLSSVF
jgi:hypothetical protein